LAAHQAEVALVNTAGDVVGARAGHAVRIEGEAVVLWSDCGRPARVLACIEHEQRLANRGQLEMHLETASGPHTIAALCAVHGWESVGL
jgi:hypothetical protein